MSDSKETEKPEDSQKITDNTEQTETKDSLGDNIDVKETSNLASNKTDEEKVESTDVKVEGAENVAEKQTTGAESESSVGKKKKKGVVYKFRDINKKMVAAWKDSFKNHQERVEVSQGDIFKGAPSADALVSPANSFGFMDGGIDMVYSLHFGWQMQERLQKVIRTEKHGEVLVGDAVIIPAYREGEALPATDSSRNEGKPIKWLISAPTMRVPMNVDETANAYLAFRAVILAVQAHNKDKNKEKITSVLLPGLGTAVGRMPAEMCAQQMLAAYETFELGLHPSRIAPVELFDIAKDHAILAGFQHVHSKKKISHVSICD